MDKKNIRLACMSKIRDLCKHIKDQKVRDTIKQNSIITGGCIVSMLLGEEVNDFDIYFRNKESAVAVAKYFADQFKQQKREAGKTAVDFEVVETEDRVSIKVKSSGVASDDGEHETGYDLTCDPDTEDMQSVKKALEASSDFQKQQAAELEQEKGLPRYRVLYLSTNAITLRNKVQFVIRFYGEPEQIHENYDFVHCTNYFSSWDNQLVLRQEALESILAKKLKYVGSKYPLCSMIRTRKFLKRGWYISAGEYVKIAFNLARFNLSDPKVLQDQLTGVDQYWFNKLLDQLKTTEAGEVDENHLIQLIDRLF